MGEDWFFLFLGLSPGPRATSFARTSASFKSSLSLRDPGQAGSRAWRVCLQDSTLDPTASMTT